MTHRYDPDQVRMPRTPCVDDVDLIDRIRLVEGFYRPDLTEPSVRASEVGS